MSKSARDVLQEFASQAEVRDDFHLHILKVKVDDNGEVEQAGNALPVTHLEIDAESNECLLHYEEGASAQVSVSDVKAAFVGAVLDYEVCASQEAILDDTHVRLDTPLIGFGENTEIKCFFAVCQI